MTTNSTSRLHQAVLLGKQLDKNQSTISEDDQLYQDAIQRVDITSINEDDVDTSDKGSFGNRQIEFIQDVYHIPEKPAADVSQPIGLLTQSDLANYIAFRKGELLTFRYHNGTAGACKYEAKKNGQNDYNCEYDWSDQLIQELIDEGACKLH